jgi:hypothetical protein
LKNNPTETLPQMLRRILADQFALLAFKPFGVEARAHYAGYLAYGLAVTWLAGVGRYWDNPKAEWWQFAGLGSIAYVFALAALLWLVIAPLKPRRWHFSDVLLFLTFTSLPAFLYAIPVEMMMPLSRAQAVNAWFLAIVASWRVILLVLFLKRAAGLSGFAIVVATLLPLTLIIAALGILNLEHVVFNLMAGNGPAPKSVNDTAYSIIFTLTLFSMFALPVLLAAYVAVITRAHSKRDN